LVTIKIDGIMLNISPVQTVARLEQVVGQKQIDYLENPIQLASKEFGID
jgi:hypothetical protein